MIQAEFDRTFAGWREFARKMILEERPPQSIQWSSGNLSLFSLEKSEDKQNYTRSSLNDLTHFSVPIDFLRVAEKVAYARDEDRWDLLYRLLYRLRFENRNLMNINVDPDVHRILNLAHSVRRDVHKMHAFVRFKKRIKNNEEVYVAWHQPEHLILPLAAPFFVRRFGDKPWSIFTPDESVHWDLEKLSFASGIPQREFQNEDQWDEIWKTYYKSIFNPARIKIKMMKSEMSPKYWSSMPETSLIQSLVREAPQRLQEMALNHNQAAHVPDLNSLEEVYIALNKCRACSLYQKNEELQRAVCGSGNIKAKIMIVEDKPSECTKILDQILEQSDLPKEKLFFTNAVKHSKTTKPTGSELHACKPWLETEIKYIKPKVIVALGSTAALAILGRLPKLSEERGKIIRGSPFAEIIILSWNPASLLQMSNKEEASLRFQQIKDDFQLVKEIFYQRQSGLELDEPLNLSFTNKF